jgi:hypothetical protein
VHGPVTPAELSQWRGRAFDPWYCVRLSRLSENSGSQLEIFPSPGQCEKSMLAGSVADPLVRERSIDRRTTEPQRRAATVSAAIAADVVCVSEGLFP